MAEYPITFAKSAREELEALDAKLVGRLWTWIEALTDDCRPAGSKKLAGTRNL